MAGSDGEARERLERMARERYGARFDQLEAFHQRRLQTMLDIEDENERANAAKHEPAEPAEHAIRTIADQRVSAAFAKGGWGSDMLDAIVAGLGRETGRFVKEKTKELAERCAKLEERIGALEDSAPKHAAHPDTIRVMVQDALEDAIPRVAALVPKPENGKSVEHDVIAGMVEGSVSRTLDLIRPQLRGEQGPPGFSPEDLELETLDGGRQIIVRLRSADGRCVQRSVRLDVPLYRGLWKSGGSAEAGDCFTYAGSLWVAGAPTTEAPGSGSQAWRLAVKRGRDAS